MIFFARDDAKLMPGEVCQVSCRYSNKWRSYSGKTEGGRIRPPGGGGLTRPKRPSSGFYTASGHRSGPAVQRPSCRMGRARARVPPCVRPCLGPREFQIGPLRPIGLSCIYGRGPLGPFGHLEIPLQAGFSKRPASAEGRYVGPLIWSAFVSAMFRLPPCDGSWPIPQWAGTKLWPGLQSPWVSRWLRLRLRLRPAVVDSDSDSDSDSGIDSGLWVNLHRESRWSRFTGTHCWRKPQRRISFTHLLLDPRFWNSPTVKVPTDVLDVGWRCCLVVY